MTTETNTPRKYLYLISRFSCGCLCRRARDTIYFCPTHRGAGFLTGEETIPLPRGMTGGGENRPEMRGMLMDGYRNHHMVLSNSQHNSVHKLVSISDGDQDWQDPEPEETGLCAACFIDEQQTVETHAAMCECGERDCVYRWCGATRGLHALWRIHVLGLSKEATGMDDRDIFSYGEYRKMSRRVRENLDIERGSLEQQAREATDNMFRARESLSGRERNTKTNLQPVYHLGWMDHHHQTATRNPERWRATQARVRIKQEMTRLIVIGAEMPPA